MTLDEPIQIVDYDPQWSDQYRSDTAEIEAALAPWSPILEHFGSTSVPGLAAKPIIDILMGLEQWPMIEGVLNALEVEVAALNNPGLDGAALPSPAARGTH